VILLDLSFSVLDSGHAGQLANAARAFLDSLTPTDSAALVTFSRGVHLAQPLTHDTERMQQALDRAIALARRRMGDATAMWDAIVAAGSLVADQGGRPVVLLLSDTQDNASWLFPGQPENARWVRHQRDRTIDVLESAGIVVEVVWVPRYRASMSGHDETYGPLTASQPANLTGGTALPVVDGNLRQRLADRLAVLRSGYVLTFTPVGVEHDGQWHKLTVRLRHRNGSIAARPGYYSIGAAR